MAAPKESWPELVGKSADEAKQHIVQDRPDVQVHIVPERSPVTMDYCSNRVRVFVNEAGNVTVAPITG